MFNRILSYLRLLSVDGVAITGSNAAAGTLACSIAGVNVVVSVSGRETEPSAAKGFAASRPLGG